MNEDIKKYKTSLPLAIFVVVFGFIAIIIASIIIGNINIFDLKSISKTQLAGIKKIGIILGILLVYMLFYIINNSRKYFIIENGHLKYYISQRLIHDWALNEAQISYQHIVSRKGNNRFYLKVSCNGMIDEIDISHLDYKAFYNDLMELQGREKLSLDVGFRDMF